MDNCDRKIHQIMQRIESGEIPRSQFAILNIQHDPDCPRLNGWGPCNCDCELHFYPASDTLDWWTTWVALRSNQNGEPS